MTVGDLVSFFSLFVYVGLLSLAVVSVLPADWLAAPGGDPEQHCCLDLPLWDFVFGTFRNPESWEGGTTSIVDTTEIA